MKKMIALMLCAILMMSCVAGMAVAEETKTPGGPKVDHCPEPQLHVL